MVASLGVVYAAKAPSQPTLEAQSVGGRSVVNLPFWRRKENWDGERERECGEGQGKEGVL